MIYTNNYNNIGNLFLAHSDGSINNDISNNTQQCACTIEHLIAIIVFCIGLCAFIVTAML